MALFKLNKPFSLIREFHLADWFTLANAVCGTGAMFSMMTYLQTTNVMHIYFACGMVLAAGVFDVLDGRIARWRQKASAMGRELDSLADVISFGVAPAVIAYGCGMQGLYDRIVLAGFVACGVSRLARYNVTAEALSDGGDKVKYFEGTPIPSSLLLVVMPIWLISIALGLFTLQFVWDSLHRDRPQMAAGRERRLAPFAGFVSGMTNGSLGASGPVVGSFLLAIGLRGKEFVFAISLVFLFQGVIRDSVFLVNGQYTGPFLLTSLALLVPALVGQQFGLRLRGRLDAKMFQRILLTVLGISALNLLIKGVSGGISAAQAAGLLG